MLEHSYQPHAAAHVWEGTLELLDLMKLAFQLQTETLKEDKEVLMEEYSYPLLLLLPLQQLKEE